MPSLAAAGCLEPLCRDRAVVRGRCRRHASAHEQERGTRTERGYDNAWLKLRARWLRLHPYCQFEPCRVLRTPAVDVDHITPVRLAPHRRLDPTNLRSACRACHARYGERLDRPAARASQAEPASQRIAAAAASRQPAASRPGAVEISSGEAKGTGPRKKTNTLEKSKSMGATV